MSLFSLLADRDDLAVLVPGAITSSIGSVSSSQRLRETVVGLERLSRVLPQAKIIYVDTGRLSADSASDSFLQEVEPYVSQCVDLRLHEKVIRAYKFLDTDVDDLQVLSGFQGLTKSLLEARALEAAFNSSWLDSFGTVAKLSARYAPYSSWRLRSPFFKQNANEGLTVLTPRPSYLRPRLQGFDAFTRTVAWSASGLSKDDLALVFSQAAALIEEHALAGRILDLEHAFLNLSSNLPLSYVRRLGVEGIVATSGRLIRL